MKSYKNRVLVFGGTHGNEFTGVFTVTRYADFFKKKYPSLKLEFIFSNPEAYKINKRFKDEDLNRAFQFLNESRPNSFEHQRAAELKDMIDASPCYVIDLHTTTSNMGKTLILTDYDQLNLYLSSEVCKTHKDARIIGSPDPHKKYLASQSKQSMMIEVGPVANGVLDATVLEGTVALLDTILKALSSLPEKLEGSFDLYEEIQDVRYPAHAQGDINAYIHPLLQGKDFSAVKGEFLAFRDFEGNDIKRVSSEELYPIFINEAAYYPQQLAFTLCKKTLRRFN